MRNILFACVLSVTGLACAAAAAQEAVPAPGDKAVTPAAKDKPGAKTAAAAKSKETAATDGKVAAAAATNGGTAAPTPDATPTDTPLADGKTVVAQAARTSPPATLAADNKEPVNLDSITITATKRNETLKDVPVSVSVTTGQTIERATVRDLIDLQTLVPSLQVNQFNAVGQTNFIIRGFGNGSGNDGIESSVGVFIDGVYRSRLSSALDDLFGIERIEVLRGPQSTLFGKNVSAGAISIITEKPEFTFNSNARIDFGNYNMVLGQGSVTGPITDTIAFSIGAIAQKRDGYLDNLVTGNKVNDRDRGTIRGNLLFEPNRDVSVRLIADYSQIKETCCGTAQLQNGPVTKLIGAPVALGGLGSQISYPETRFNNTITFNTDPKNKLSDGGLSAQVDWKSPYGNFTSITAYREQKNESWQDVDFTGANIVNKDQANKIKTFSQEFRLASDGKGPLNWLAGAFFMKEKFNPTGVNTLFGNQVRAFADGLSGTVATGPLKGQSNIYALEYLQSLTNPLVVPGKTYFQQGQGIYDQYTMDDTSYSLFGNLSYNVTDKFKLTGGIAYLNDKKQATSNVVLTDKFAQLNLRNVPELVAIGLPGNTFQALGPLQFFYGNTLNHGPVNYPNDLESGELKADKVTYLANAAYNFGPVNVYASYTTGWKAGAYNLSSDGRPTDLLGIGRYTQPEDVTAYELGLKSAFRQGYLNLAIFQQTIKDFQTNDYTGTGYVLVNAGKVTVKGVEIDSAYAPTDWLALTGSATYLDPKYNSYLHAPCVSYDIVNCPQNPNTGGRPPFRDLSGQTPPGIPTWVVSASATLSHHFDGFDAYLRGDYYYVDPTHLTNSTPPNISTYGSNNFNASMGFTTRYLGNRYQLVFWGRNLTDYRTMVGAFPTVAQEGSYSGFPNQPRTYGATFRAWF